MRFGAFSKLLPIVGERGGRAGDYTTASGLAHPLDYSQGPNEPPLTAEGTSESNSGGCY